MCPVSNDLCVRGVDNTQSLTTVFGSCSKTRERATTSVPWRDHRTKESVRSKTEVCDKINVTKTSNWTWVSRQQKTYGHPIQWIGDQWMVVDPEEDSRKDGGTTSMHFGNLLHENRIFKTASRRRAVLRQ